ncbi:MAG: hypothetical protein LH618_14030 [Saprospiraceae bacterium]|nr:hypothetical protein [Saprospiraceae bacterium]
MFSLFQRLGGRNYEGTGIGLSIAKKIVENHGGYLTAQGEPGVGARFFIFLPKEPQMMFLSHQLQRSKEFDHA